MTESARQPARFTAQLPEVSEHIVIDHDGEDVDLVHLGNGRVLPTLIPFPVTEEWEPEVYSACLEKAGWRLTGEWDRSERTYTAPVEPIA